ncbi:hypothetical protein LQ948_12780 [Jiella sp. MQZ9-1]|uniref:Uncharacterized protein n=1 Tax=Jiella flava TaxID=2816857 RepID=A0A939FZD2_9HYPH|nr:hypothetical protein [Jiella flava]MBO0663511.1 hypothetical protein [Jiella flava]MCD2472086.1 hypothetical protein [Jiella flava]
MTLEDWHLGEGDSFQDRQLAAEYVPILKAHFKDDEPDRIERLRRTYAMAQNLFLMVEGRRLPRRVVIAMQDHKGCLAVTFIDESWKRFLEPFFRLAWRSEGEAAERVSLAVRQ